MDTTQETLSFSPKEKAGIAGLMVLVAAVYLAPYILPHSDHAPITTADTSWMHTLALRADTPATEEAISPYNRYYHKASPTHTATTLFNFDPNTASLEELEQLGLRTKTATTIINYRNKGGQFRKPGDLQKIYGLRKEDYERLAPYIIINNKNTTTPATSPPFEKSSYQPRTIEINTADTTAYKSLYGIGSKLAYRIVNFRNKLGGFISIDQIGETFGLPDSTFRKIKPQLRLEHKNIRKLSINAASFDDLNAHPYISYKLAQLIVQRRTEAGAFTAISDIKSFIGATKDDYEKIAPYLEL